MEFFPWKDEYKLGIEEIDTQHKKLFDLINKLYESFMIKSTEKIMKDVLKELLDYIRFHFETEEKFLKQVNYPKIKEHILLHEAFGSKAIEFRHSHRKGIVITMSVMSFLRNWLSEHILKADRDYVNYLNTNI